MSIGTYDTEASRRVGSLLDAVAAHYDDLPAAVREAYLQERIAGLQAQLKTTRADLNTAQTALIAQERENARLIMAADADVRKIARLEGHIAAQREQLTQLRAELEQARSGGFGYAQLTATMDDAAVTAV